MAAPAGDTLTTIAVKDGIVAYDSRSTGGDIVITDDCDKTAKEAVELAAKRDIYTGGKVRTFRV